MHEPTQTSIVVELAHQLSFDLDGLGVALTNEGLAQASVTKLQGHAATIRRLQEQAIRDIGRELLAARDVTEHGGWATFLASIGMRESTARNYMNVARQFGDAPAAISATVADLPPSIQYALASPKAEQGKVGEIIAEIAAGAPVPSVSEVRQRLEAQQPQPQQRQGPLIIEDDDDAEEEDYEEVPEVSKPAPKAVAAPPPALKLSPAPAPLPAPLSLEAGFAHQTRKLRVITLELLRAAIEQLEAETNDDLPDLIIDAERLHDAAHTIVTSQLVAGAASLLALSAVEA